MRFLVTCGPTYEPLDQVRRLTNFSTGKLGIEFANHLAARGHGVTVLRGYYSIYREPCRAEQIGEFTTTENLASSLRALAAERWDAVFHAAAVSDFCFGTVFQRGTDGDLLPVTSGKFSTREGNLLAELIPTPKIIASLRDWFGSARLFGWKYEVQGTREQALQLGESQRAENRTDFCVVNGAAYGGGYGVLGASGFIADCPTPDALYERLESLSA